MSAATVSAPKTATCNVTFGTNWILIENQDTKNSKRLDIGLGGNWNDYKGDEAVLIAKLRDDKAESSEMELTATEMKLFVRLCDFRKPVQVKEESARKIAERVTRNVTGNVEQQVNGLKNVIDGIPEEYTSLGYDIPEGTLPNPSWLLWRFGFRRLLSSWVLPSRNLNHPVIQNLLREWDAHGIEWDTVRYHPEEMGRIKEMAQKRLDKMIREVHTSLITTIIKADNQLKLIQEDMEKTAADADKADESRDNKVRAIIKKAGERMAAALECAELFDLNESVTDLLKGLKEAIESQRTTFNESMAIKGRKLCPKV